MERVIADLGQTADSNMNSRHKTIEEARLIVENIGGVNKADVQFSPGITVLKGRNATNRTSLLQAIMAACGSNEISFKADADEEKVELSINDQRYSRILTRDQDSIHFEGEPYLDDSTVADLFAFLIE